MKNSDSATLIRVVKIMKLELTAGLIIIMIIVLISGCTPAPVDADGSSGDGGYDSPERKEARNKMNDVKGMIDDCEIVIERAEKVGVKSSLIKPAREDLINANKCMRNADTKYGSGKYNSAKSDAESAESYVKSAKEYAESQIKQLRDEVKTVLKETEANIISSENYIKTNSDIGNNTITAMEMINFAKDEIESAWTKYDEEKYGVALEKSKKAKSYSFEAKNMVEMVVKELTKKTIDIATADVGIATKRVKNVDGAGVSIPSAKSKLYDAMDYLKMAEKNYNQGDYEKAQANAVKASRLSIESKDDADRKLENFVESDLVMLRKDIRDAKEKIDEAQLLGRPTDNEERQVEDVENLCDDAESCKLSGEPEELLSAARYITDGKNCLMDIDQSLNEKIERAQVTFIGAAVAVLFVFIVIFGRRGK